MNKIIKLNLDVGMFLILHPLHIRESFSMFKCFGHLVAHLVVALAGL